MEGDVTVSRIRAGVPMPKFHSEQRGEIISSMKKMNIGDYIDVDKKIKNQYYSFAKIAGIKITVRHLENSEEYGCWRIQDVEK